MTSDNAMHAALLAEQVGERNTGIGMRRFERDCLAQRGFGLNRLGIHAQCIAEQIVQCRRVGKPVDAGAEQGGRSGNVHAQKAFAGVRPTGHVSRTVPQAVYGERGGNRVAGVRLLQTFEGSVKDRRS